MPKNEAGMHIHVKVPLQRIIAFLSCRSIVEKLEVLSIGDQKRMLSPHPKGPLFIAVVGH